MSEIQAVIFNKHKYSISAAESWLTKYNITPMKYHITKNYIRFRIRAPSKYKYYSMYNINDNIKLVIGYK